MVVQSVKVYPIQQVKIKGHLWKCARQITSVQTHETLGWVGSPVEYNNLNNGTLRMENIVTHKSGDIKLLKASVHYRQSRQITRVSSFQITQTYTIPLRFFFIFTPYIDA